MSSRQVCYGIFLAAGIAILVLLIMPAVHVPFIVVHGPVSALRAQRSAWLFRLLVLAAAFLFAGLLPSLSPPMTFQFSFLKLSTFAPISLNFALRC